MERIHFRKKANLRRGILQKRLILERGHFREEVFEGRVLLKREHFRNEAYQRGGYFRK